MESLKETYERLMKEGNLGNFRFFRALSDGQLCALVVTRTEPKICSLYFIGETKIPESILEQLVKQEFPDLELQKENICEAKSEPENTPGLR